QGTAGEVVFPCFSCGEFIVPSRDNLIGWHDATTEAEAEAASRWACPACGILFDDAQRIQQLTQARLRHRGQIILPDGSLHGEIPATKTMGFRYSAATNTFVTAGIVGADEWRGMREVDRDNSEREILQWTWALPAKPKETAVEPLDWKTVMHRQSQYRRGLVPADCSRIAAGVDVRAAQLDWFVIAKHDTSGQPFCVDYGYEPIQRELTDLPTAIRQAVRLLMEKFEAGWELENGGQRGAEIVMIDAGWETDLIRSIVATNDTWNTCKGFGFKQHSGTTYHAPKDKSKITLRIGEGWHDVAFLDGTKRYREYQNNADHWKRRVHQALSVEATSAAALLLPRTDKPEGRMEVAKQLTAEREVQEFQVGKGTVTKWTQTFSRNHLLDACYLAFVGHSVLEFERKRAEKIAENRPQNGVISGKKPEKFVKGWK
ncbi:MAG: terminase gpA endonuclease subunit, partial [Planctomyces sp.]